MNGIVIITLLENEYIQNRRKSILQRNIWF